jgi:hypothetical protein
MSYLRKVGSGAFGLLMLAFLAVAGAVWGAALIGVEPVAGWYQTLGGGLMLFMMVCAVILTLSCLVYGLYRVLRHIRAWSLAAREASIFLISNSDWSILVRQAVLPLAATVFLFLAARSYYLCHFADGYGSTPMMAAAADRAILLSGVGTATLGLSVCLRIGARFKSDSAKRAEAFRAWLEERAALRSQQMDGLSSSHRVLLKTERAEIESILIHFNKCFPRG